MREDAGEERQQVLLLAGQLGEVTSQVEIGDAVGRLRVELDGCSLHGVIATGNRFEFHRDLAQLERGKRREVLPGFLVGLEAERVGDYARAIGVG